MPPADRRYARRYAIACVLAREMPWARVVACDVSPEALAVAALNRDRLGLRDRLPLVRHMILAETAEEEAEVVEATVDYDDEELMDKMQKAARLLRITRDTLRYKMKKFNLR